MRRLLLEFHIYAQLTNIKLHKQLFTTVTLVQFCVSKSSPFNVTSLITVQLDCNNTEVENPLHPDLICRLPINRFLLCSQSEWQAKYIHLLFINLIHIAHLTQLISSHSFSNISPLLKQFHSSRFSPIATHYSITLCTDIRSIHHGFTMIQFYLFYHQTVLSSPIKTQYWFFSVNVQKFLIFQSYWYSNQFNNLTSYCWTRRTVWKNKNADMWHKSL